MKRSLLIPFVLATAFFFLTATTGLGQKRSTVDIANLPKAEVVKVYDHYPKQRNNECNLASKDGLSFFYIDQNEQSKKMELHQWNVADETITKSIVLPMFGVCSADLSANDRVLAVGSIGEGILCWDIKTGKHLILKPHEEFLSYVSLSPDGALLASTGHKDKQIKLTKTKSGASAKSTVLDTFAGRGDSRPPRFSNDGKYFVDNTASDVVKMWDTKAFKPLWTVKNDGNPVNDYAFTPNSKSLIIVSFRGQITVVDVKTGEKQNIIQTKDYSILGISVSPNGKTFATFGLNRVAEKPTVLIWNTEKMEPISSFDDFTGNRISFSYLTDGFGLIVFGETPNHIRVPDVN